MYVKKSERESVLFLFGRNLAEMRRKKDISQDQLAFDSDISLSALSKIERGVLNISICNAYKIAKALKVPYKDLFDFELPANKK